MSHRRIARLPRGLRERVTIGRGCSAIETGADRIHRIQRAQYSGKLWRRIISLLLDLAIPAQEYQVLGRAQHDAFGPDLHRQRVLAALKLDLVAHRTERTTRAIHRIEPVIAIGKNVECLIGLWQPFRSRAPRRRRRHPVSRSVWPPRPSRRVFPAHTTSVRRPRRAFSRSFSRLS